MILGPLLSPFAWLFDDSPYVPRALCGDWPFWLMRASQVSDLLTFLAYEATPATLGWVWWQRRRDLSPGWSRVLALFVVFIAACGVTHLDDILVFWWPAYRWFVAVKAFTAASSMAAMVLLIPVAVAAVRMPTVEQYRRLLDEAHEQRQLKHDLLDRANARILMLEERRSEGQRTVDISRAIEDVRAILRPPEARS